ncbi:MAG: hypothetical protein Q9M31_00495 [Mariprofundus sp.]|nr:hypothetical protein [Mariprofundus sp.]
MNILFSKHQPDATDEFQSIHRRGFDLGWVKVDKQLPMADSAAILACWKQDQAVLLPSMINTLPFQSAIEQSHHLMQQLLETEELLPLFDTEPYLSRLQQLPLLASSAEEHDKQGIEKLYFDAESKEGELIAEGLWCKASWLSFHDDDASLRFRFSFGMEGFEDVAADPLKQQWAGTLCDALFPESAAITNDSSLLPLLTELLEGEPAFVERIVYFNAPNGGAQMHHDVERGHAGVVYAQLTGATFWLALAKPLLIDELILFAADSNNNDAIQAVLPDEKERTALSTLLQDRAALAEYMDEPDHELLEALMDRCPDFNGYLCKRGYGYILQAGDLLLLPQRDLDHCVWHAVTCLGDQPGEALSFALRPKV